MMIFMLLGDIRGDNFFRTNCLVFHTLYAAAYGFIPKGIIVSDEWIYVHYIISSMMTTNGALHCLSF